MSKEETEGTEGNTANRVELADYLAILQRRSPLLAIPVIAAVIMASVSFALEPAYRADATVAVPREERSPAEVSQTIKDYTTAATARPVLERISTATGVDVGRLESDLTLRRLNDSSFIEISFVSGDSREPTRVVHATAQATAAFLFERQLWQAGAPRAGVSYEQIRNQRMRLAASVGSTLSPSQRFESKQQVVKALRVDRAQAVARNEEFLAENLAEVIARQERQLRNLWTLQVASQLPHITEADNSAEALSRLPGIARRTVAAAGAGLLLAVGLAVALELTGYRRLPGEAGAGQVRSRTLAGLGGQTGRTLADAGRQAGRTLADAGGRVVRWIKGQ